MDKLISILVLIIGGYIFIKVLPFVFAVIAFLFLLAVIVAVINGINNPNNGYKDEYTDNNASDGVIDVEYTEEEIKDEDNQQ